MIGATGEEQREAVRFRKNEGQEKKPTHEKDDVVCYSTLWLEGPKRIRKKNHFMTSQNYLRECFFEPTTLQKQEQQIRSYRKLDWIPRYHHSRLKATQFLICFFSDNSAAGATKLSSFETRQNRLTPFPLPTSSFPYPSISASLRCFFMQVHP